MPSVMVAPPWPCEMSVNISMDSSRCLAQVRKLAKALVCITPILGRMPCSPARPTHSLGTGPSRKTASQPWSTLLLTLFRCEIALIQRASSKLSPSRRPQERREKICFDGCFRKAKTRAPPAACDRGMPPKNDASSHQRPRAPTTRERTIVGGQVRKLHHGRGREPPRR